MDICVGFGISTASRLEAGGELDVLGGVPAADMLDSLNVGTHGGFRSHGFLKDGVLSCLIERLF